MLSELLIEHLGFLSFRLTYTRCTQKFADIVVILIDVIVIIDLRFIIDSSVTLLSMVSLSLSCAGCALLL